MGAGLRGNDSCGFGVIAWEHWALLECWAHAGFVCYPLRLERLVCSRC